jgi:hypothetical protein
VPQKGVKEELARAADDKFYSYARIQHRLQWALMERERKKREDDVAEKERSMWGAPWQKYSIGRNIHYAVASCFLCAGQGRNCRERMATTRAARPISCACGKAYVCGE